MSNNSKKHSNSVANHKQNQNRSASMTNKYLLIPVILVIAIVPLIVRAKYYTTDLNQYPWFSLDGDKLDFFQYNKQLLLNLVSVAMCIIIAVKAYKDKNTIKFAPIYIPLAVYAILYFLSSVISKYRKYSFIGNFEQFESIFAILGYCLIVYYIFLFLHTEQDINLIINSLLYSSFIISLIAITQTIGFDIFATKFGRKIITPVKMWALIDSYTIEFGKHYAYTTLYNPNYVGVYVALVAPLFFILSLFIKDRKWKVLYAVGFIGLVISTIGARSSAGVISLIAAGIFSLIFLWRYLVKYKKFIIPVFLLGLLSLVVINITNDNIVLNKLQNTLRLEKKVPNLTDIQTKDDCLVIEYSGNTFTLQSFMNDAKAISFMLLDESGQPISVQLNADNTYSILDERFPGFTITPVMLNEIYGYSILIDGKEWYFSNYTGDGTYYYCNAYGRFDKIETAPSAIFTGYEYLFTDRGYMWSRTMPLIKDYILLGVGANNYVYAFPQHDYVNQANFNHGLEIVTRPHNIYMQTSIQGGFIAFLAYMVFYFWYFINSIKLFIKGRFQNLYTQVGFGIFIGTIGYMICAIVNDSNISTAPVFWAMIGVGIVANSKAKALSNVD